MISVSIEVAQRGQSTSVRIVLDSRSERCKPHQAREQAEVNFNLTPSEFDVIVNNKPWSPYAAEPGDH